MFCICVPQMRLMRGAASRSVVFPVRRRSVERCCDPVPDLRVGQQDQVPKAVDKGDIGIWQCVHEALRGAGRKDRIDCAMIEGDPGARQRLRVGIGPAPQIAGVAAVKPIFVQGDPVVIGGHQGGGGLRGFRDLFQWNGPQGRSA